MGPVQAFEEQVTSLLSFCPPDSKETYLASVRALIEDVCVSILVSPVSETMRLRGQLEVLLMLMGALEPEHDVLRETIKAILEAEES